MHSVRVGEGLTKIELYLVIVLTYSLWEHVIARLSLYMHSGFLSVMNSETKDVLLIIKLNF